MGLAQDPLAVGEQVLAVLDGLGEAVAEVVQAPDRPAAQAQQGLGQRGVLSAEVGCEVLVQGHDLLDGITGGGPVLPRLGQGPGHRRQQAADACAEPGQGAVAGPGAPGPRAWSAGARPRSASSTLKVSSDALASRPSASSTLLRPGGRAGAGVLEQALLPGGIQQRPGNPGGRQQRDHIDQPAAQAVWSPSATASRASTIASATPCGYGSPAARCQVVLHRHGPQPGQVGRVVQVLGGDHRRGLRQRQRQEPQLAPPAPAPRPHRTGRCAGPGTPAPRAR